ncbi:MAG: N-acetyltransferase [Desulfitobacteriaceae bacterium]|nr:N-acetyltransferase [Desulfitobacteriaceae bacterium]MDD4401684.1 N-acetyltransferase [Desulfitobacteriaceae bacterium]
MELRRAKLGDVEVMMSLINKYAEQGSMLPRSRSMLYENIREFLVVVENNQIVAVGSLHIIWEDLAEIRALAVTSEFMGKGLGKKLVESLINEALDLGCYRVFALTYQTEFFENCGFNVIDKEEMPQKVWKECINCIKFPNCDEVAVMYISDNYKL